MKYTSEFQIEPFFKGREELDRRVEHQKKINASQIGELLIKTIGFEKLEYDDMKFRMEFQAFSQNDWQDFKKKVMRTMEKMFEGDAGYNNWLTIRSIILELENIGNEKVKAINEFLP